ncbi:MAG: hypothetical protein R3B52_00930 [Candidatus Paceibacterota bacterium]
MAIGFLKRLRSMQRARDLHGTYSGAGAAIPCQVLRHSGERLRGTLCWTKQVVGSARLALRLDPNPLYANDFFSPAVFNHGKEDALLVLV